MAGALSSTARATVDAKLPLPSTSAIRWRCSVSRTLRAWAQRNRFGNVTTPQFIALAEQQSGRDLDHFFDVWLYQPGKPLTW